MVADATLKVELEASGHVLKDCGTSLFAITESQAVPYTIQNCDQMRNFLLTSGLKESIRS